MQVFPSGAAAALEPAVQQGLEGPEAQGLPPGSAQAPAVTEGNRDDLPRSQRLRHVAGVRPGH